MPTIPLKHKCLSIILIRGIVSHKKQWSLKKVKKKKKKKNNNIYKFFLIENRHGLGKKGGYFQFGMGLEFGP